MNTYKCPLCGMPMIERASKTGVYMRCEGPCVPYCHENVEGHGAKPKEAYEVACLKFKKPEGV